MNITKRKKQKSVHLEEALHEQLKIRCIKEKIRIEHLVHQILVTDMKIYKKYNKETIK